MACMVPLTMYLLLFNVSIYGISYDDEHVLSTLPQNGRSKLAFDCLLLRESLLVRC